MESVVKRKRKSNGGRFGGKLKRLKVGHTIRGMATVGDCLSVRRAALVLQYQIKVRKCLVGAGWEVTRIA